MGLNKQWCVKSNCARSNFRFCLNRNFCLYSKIRVLPSGTLSRTQDIENFATASRSRCQQHASSSTVELVDDTYTTVDESWLFTTSQSTVTLWLTGVCCWFVLQLVSIQLTRFWLTARRAVRLQQQSTHTQPFNGLWSGTTRVGRYQKKHSPAHTYPDHPTSFINSLHLLRSLFSVRARQSSLTTSLQVLFGLPPGLGPSTSYSMHFFAQSSSSFRSTCPYQRSLFCCSTNATVSRASCVNRCLDVVLPML